MLRYMRAAGIQPDIGIYRDLGTAWIDCGGDEGAAGLSDCVREMRALGMEVPRNFNRLLKKRHTKARPAKQGVAVKATVEAVIEPVEDAWRGTEVGRDIFSSDTASTGSNTTHSSSIQDDISPLSALSRRKNLTTSISFSDIDSDSSSTSSGISIASSPDRESDG